MKAREELKRCKPCLHKNGGSHEPASTKESEAKMFNQSVSTTKRQRFVDDHATPEQKKEVKSGEKSYNGLYNEIKKGRSFDRPIGDEVANPPNDGIATEPTETLTQSDLAEAVGVGLETTMTFPRIRERT